MVVSPEEIIKRLQSPNNSAAIAHAIDHENRIKFHAKTVHDRQMASPYLDRFLEWVKTGIGLPADKFEVFEGMLQFPLATTSSVDTIFDEFEKIFTANDAYFNVTLLDDTLKEDFTNYINEVLKLRSYFKTEGFDAFKTHFNCIFLIDLPAIQTTPWPEPYVRKIPIRYVHELEVERDADGTERIGFFIYKATDRRFVAVDGAAWRVYQQRETGDANGPEFILLSEAIHNLGFCPATFLPKSPLYSGEDNSPIARKGPLAKSASDLDYLLYWTNSQRCVEAYGPFPVAIIPEDDDCAQEGCHNGIITSVGKDGHNAYYPCPYCTKKSLVGVGTVYKQAVPQSSDDPDMQQAVQFITMSPENLDHIEAQREKLDMKIYEDSVGDNNEMITKEAINEDQVKASAKGRENVILSIARDFELCEKFFVDTMGRLRYGSYYVSCDLSYGQQFITLRSGEVVERFELIKKAGFPVHLIATQRELFIQTEFRNNPYQRARAKILSQLEPWIDLSVGECLGFQYNLLFPVDFLLKSDFSKYIAKFERENADIVEWGSAIDFATKIDNLQKLLYDQAKEQASAAVKLEPKKEPGVKG